MKTTELRISDLIEDKEVIARPTVDEYHLKDLVNAIRREVELPPVIVFQDGEIHFLVDGSHRCEAYRKCEKDTIKAFVHKGTKRDAILYSCKVNSTHGLPRTNKDKQNVVRKLLNDKEWQEWADNVIAEQCAVSQPFVSLIRKKIEKETGRKSPTQRITKNGKLMKVARSRNQRNLMSNSNPTETDPSNPNPVNADANSVDATTIPGLSENEIVDAKGSIISSISALKALDGLISHQHWDEAMINKFTKTKSNLETEWTKLALLMTKLEEKLQMTELEEKVQ